MKLTSVVFLFLAVFGRCSPASVSLGEPLADGATIRTGTSFGMCSGYCRKDYVLNGTSLTLTTSSHSPAQYPTKTCQTTTSQENWNSLKGLVNLDTFSKIPERLGCPDCADGGAEYIEVESGDQQHRVTFEYGQTIPGFEQLVNALRTQREQFNECK